MPDYTESDLKALQNLMVFDDQAGLAGRPPANEHRGGRGHATSYPAADLDQFSKLMNFGDVSRQPVPARLVREAHSAAWPIIEPIGTATNLADDPALYTESDLYLFGRIHLPSHMDSTAWSGVEFGSGEADESSGRKAYAPRDLEAFSALMQFGSGTAREIGQINAAEPGLAYGQPARRETLGRAVVMKIVDTDKERAKERQNYLSGRAAIKIVYSDAGGGRPRVTG